MRDLKDLTNEEKKEIVDAVTKLLQTFYNLKVTEERLNSVSNMASNILKMTLDKNLIASVLSAHAERYNVAQEEFFKMFGMGSDNTAFWEYSKLVDKERQAEASIPDLETAAKGGNGGEPNGNGGTKE